MEGQSHSRKDRGRIRRVRLRSEGGFLFVLGVNWARTNASRNNSGGPFLGETVNSTIILVKGGTRTKHEGELVVNEADQRHRE